ncbi:FtsK/SpoIIIE domain-containing protein [Flexivirga caeni]|nr:FtsK/SpoIIIE domain-containing protein [Flexivirga caeni]
MPAVAESPEQSTTRAIRLHLVGRECSRTVCVRAGDGTRWAQLRESLRAAGLSVPEPAYIADQVLYDDSVLGQHPLLTGAQVAAAPTAQTPQHLLDLVVAEGPVTGARTPLGTAPQRIGRAPSNTLVLHDPGLSRAHLVVGVDQGRAMVSDAGSTNGSAIDGVRLAQGCPAELRAGQRLRAGSSTLIIERALPHAVRAASDETCRIPFQRASRTPPQLSTTTLERPTPPEQSERARIPWPVIALPMVVAVAMAWLLHNTMFLMFAFLGPVMMIGQYLSDRQGGSARAKRKTAEYAAACTQLADDRLAAAASELALRRRLTPPISDTLRAAAARDHRLWARSVTHDDYLMCRVGTGTIPSMVRVTGGGLPTETITLSEAPILLSLNESRVIGITGNRADCHRLADGLLLQVAAWQSPRFVRVAVICDSAASRADWEWAADLPHLTPRPHASSSIVDLETDETACQQLLSALAPDGDKLRGAHETAPVSTVLVLDGWSQLGHHAAVSALLAASDPAGVAIIALGDSDDLPAECAVTIELADPTRLVTRGAVNAAGCPDLVEPALTRAVAHHLAQTADATPDADAGTPPERASLVDVWRTAGVDITSGDDVARHWRSHPRATRTPWGVAADGVLWTDLAADGPHALIAGTTGAGKSELLQTLVTSLAVANRPDELVFVLVDYKGGAAFQQCAELPHTVGLVTDLDAHLTARALSSLGAEVRRREQQLAAVGAKDLEDYQRLAPTQSLPRLVLIIDEFRVLADELPDFIAGLVRLAAVGRSLGIHLVLATQRPAGVVSADIRANVNLRIALRMRDGTDSQDVIESADAAQIPATLPGRAILRTGGGRPVTFQSARIGGWSGIGSAAIEVSRVPATGHSPVLLTTTRSTDDGPTDLRRAVDAIRWASEKLGIAPPDSPWLPPLPSLVTTGELSGDAVDLSGNARGPEAIRFGLLDLPDQQATRPIAWAPESDGHLAVIGGPRSGRSSLLRTIAVQAASAWPHGGLALYAIDTGSALGALAALPQCGAVIERDDAGRISRLVQWLQDETRSRQQQFAREEVAGFGEHARLGGRLPRILLLIDGWEALTEVSEETTMGRLADDILQLLRDGRAVGLYVAASGGRSLGTGRVASHFSGRLVLGLADRTDVVLLGMKEADLPVEMPPGRAVNCPDGLELQVASLIDDLSGSSVVQYISAVAQGMVAPEVHRFRPMPSRCSRADLRAEQGTVMLGIGGATVEPVGLPLGSFGELAALIAGPARSGRTTTLTTIAHQLGDRAICWIDGHGRPPQLPSVARVVDAARPEALATWLNATPGGALLVDDLDELIGSPIDDLIADYLQHGRRDGGIVCATGQSETLANAFRGAVAELRRRQTGVILQPGRRDGDLLGATLGPAGRPQPGRGALVIRSRAVPVQVAAA